MPFVRWLVSLVALVTLMGQPLGAFASAGEETDIRCCCPDPAECACHDHDAPSNDTLKRCAGAEHQVLPVVATTTIPPVFEHADVPRARRAIDHREIALSDGPPSEPETPPF